MNSKIKTKLMGLLIASFISVFLSSILSFCLVQIFSRQPQEILNINSNAVIYNITDNEYGTQIFILCVLAFMLFMLVSVFKVFDLEDYLSKTYTVTPDIKIPIPVGKNQTQQGSAWWLEKKSLYKKPYGVNTIDPSNPVIHDLFELSEKQREIEEKKIKRLEEINNLVENQKISYSDAEQKVPKIKEQKLEEYNKRVNSNVFAEGGVCVGKKDRTILYPAKSKLFRKSSVYFY